MAVHQFDEDHQRLLPRPLEALLIGWMRRLAGAFLVVFCACLTLVLLGSLASNTSVSPWPPSEHTFWLFVTPVAEIFLQTFGLTSLLGLICLAVWGVQLALFETIDRFRLRAGFALVSLLAISGGCAALPTANGWFSESGYGGLVGDLSYDLVAGIFAQFRLAASGTLSGLTLFAIGFWAYAYALDIDGHLVKRFAQPLRKRVGGVPVAKADNEVESESSVASASSFAGRLSKTVFGVTHVSDDDVDGTPAANTTASNTSGLAASKGGAKDGTGLLGGIVSNAFIDRSAESEETLEETLEETSEETSEETFSTSIGDQSGIAVDDVAPSGQVVAIARRFAPLGAGEADRNVQMQALASSTNFTSELDDITLPAFLNTDPRHARSNRPDRSRTRPSHVQDTFKQSEKPSSSSGGATADEVGGQPDSGEGRGLVVKLAEVLEDFRVTGNVVRVSSGTAVDRIDFKLSPGINADRVVTLADDIARVMQNKSVRVLQLNDTRTVGFELAREKPDPVKLRSLLEDKSYRTCSARVPLILGGSVGGEPIIGDLTLMPNLLIAGASTDCRAKLINAFLLSLIYRSSPDDCRLLLVGKRDRSSSSAFNGLADIPHLLAPPTEGASKAIVALEWLVTEMRQRYTKIQELGEQDVASYNNRLQHAKRVGEKLTKSIQIGFDQVTGRAQFAQKPLQLERLPYIVVVLDEIEELADEGGEIFASTLARISSLAEKVGVHLILARGQAEHDCVDWVLDKLRLTRLCLKVASKAESRAQLGEAGAERLLNGLDFLVAASGGACVRGHGPEVQSSDIDALVTPLVAQKRRELVGRLVNELQGVKPSDVISMCRSTSSPTAKRRLNWTGACS